MAVLVFSKVFQALNSALIEKSGLFAFVDNFVSVRLKRATTAS